MGKVSYAAVATNATDASFRSWGSTLAAAIVTAGLIKTTDTGQVDWATVTTSATVGLSRGYEVYRFNDPLQSTAPIFIKLEFGTSASSANTPGAWVTIGTGSDGAGNITGVLMARTPVNRAAALSGSAAWPVYVCVKDGFFGLAAFHGNGGVNRGGILLVVERVKDDAAANLDEAIYVLSGSLSLNSPTGQVIVFSSGAIYTGVACHIPQGATASVVGSDVQVFRHFPPTPRLRYSSGVCTYVNSEFASGTASAFTLALVGSTPRTYIPLGNLGIASGAEVMALTALSSGSALAMLWES